MTILKFPEDRALQNRLESLQTELNSVYEALHMAHSLANFLEDAIDKNEYLYDQTLESYANVVGIENIEVGYLEFASRNVVLKDGELVWEKEDETEV